MATDWFCQITSDWLRRWLEVKANGKTFENFFYFFFSLQMHVCGAKESATVLLNDYNAIKNSLSSLKTVGVVAIQNSVPSVQCFP